MERALAEAHKETVRRFVRARVHPCGAPAELGRVAELAYAAHAGLAVWSCVPRWLRAAIHGGDARTTTRDRGVDAVGLRDRRLVLAQVKWYRDGACVSGDADMKLALIAAMAQRGLGLAEPPRTILVVRRGARTARSSPGTEGMEYVELTDEELGLTPVRGLELLPSLHGALQSAECEFEAYRYKARLSGQANVQQRCVTCAPPSGAR
jgi:hypothetical protein